MSALLAAHSISQVEVSEALEKAAARGGFESGAWLVIAD
jgi:hypothetical protein